MIYTAFQAVIDCCGAFRTLIQEWDMYQLFGVHISWFEIVISLFIIGTVAALLGFEFEED